MYPQMYPHQTRAGGGTLKVCQWNTRPRMERNLYSRELKTGGGSFDPGPLTNRPPHQVSRRGFFRRVVYLGKSRIYGSPHRREPTIPQRPDVPQGRQRGECRFDSSLGCALVALGHVRDIEGPAFGGQNAPDG